MKIYIKTMTKQKDWEKWFDEKFPISIDYPPITSSEVLTNMEVDRRHKRAIYKHEEIKDFIHKLLTLQKKEIVEMIQKKIDDIYEEPEKTEDDVLQAHAFEEIIEDIDLLTKE